MLLSIQTLLSAIVDYAGLFPPAKLSLAAAMAEYEHYQTSPEHWMLSSSQAAMKQDAMPMKS